MPLAALLVAATLALAAGCTTGKAAPPDLSLYPRILPETLFAFAWGGKASDPQAVEGVTVAFRPDGASRVFRLFACFPPERSCDTLEHFHDLDVGWRPMAGGVLGAFRLKHLASDYRVVVIAERPGEMATSPIVDVRPVSRPTRRVGNLLEFDVRQGEFLWHSAPDAALYVLTVDGGRTQPVAAGVATLRRSWLYPQLLGIVRHFHDPEAVRPLEPGEEYTVRLFGLDPDHWAEFVSEARLVP
ncbi:MAG: hypothetical protein KatS3mg076_2630 [Candidatus Binatia bacterium]|nr:MAG: hypothetical protein KatS3mg076_2630 [Candidatus Binatia bacterium]